MLARLATAVLAVLLLPVAAPALAAPAGVPAAKKPHAAKQKPRAKPRRRATPKPRPPRKPAERRAVAAVPPQLVPDDPFWSDEWGLAHIGLPTLWRAAAAASASPAAVIAVVDTGVDASRPDLAGAVLPGYDVPAGSASVSDAVGHGTSVAEIAAGRGNDGVGAAGVCWRCEILPVEIAPNGTATAADMAAGIRYAVDHGANVVNLSMVLTGPDAGVADAIADAELHGVLVVAAAGNDGSGNATYPASYPGVISVVGVDPGDHLYSWSTHGAWATVAAPGCATVADGSGGASDFCGSSAAAPVVSGLAGLLWSSGLGSAAAVRAALTAATVPVDGQVAGGGRVDAALLAARLPK